MNKLTLKKAAPKNLYRDCRIVSAANSYVELRKKTRRAYSLSQLVQELLVCELRKQGITLPQEFSVK